MRRAGRDLLDGDSVQADNLLGFGDGPCGVALATLAHGVVAPGVHFVVWAEKGRNNQPAAAWKNEKDKTASRPSNERFWNICHYPKFQQRVPLSPLVVASTF